MKIHRMDPQDPNSFRHKFCFVNGITYLSKGFRVIAPDLRGYDQTECIAKFEFFTLNTRGAFVVWRMCIYYSERVRAVASLCIPYIPPNDTYLSNEAFAEIYPQFEYMVYLSHPKAEIELDGNPEAFLKAVYRTSKPDDSRKIYDGNSMTEQLLKA
ncbi:1716_t:CDS:2 [Cetraspora pellucida]|uniref:1716_t:CDS:1 n=1 Tax=Cetraspora pellucida TaxID=1433469 RepID=A0A9N9CMC7_9GLOM|nr:1716_t:CDS:2 [Cetraspora pellucida]